MHLDPKIQLVKTQETGPSSNAVNKINEQSVIVEGRMLVSRTAFVGHSFLPTDQEVVVFVKNLLKEMQINSATGEAAEACQIHEKVKRRILAADLFVGIFTRRCKLESQNLWTTTEWVIEEMTFAAANDKKLVILREEGIANIGGMQGNWEYIEFNRDRLHLAAIKLLQTLWSLNPGKFKFNTNRPPEMSLDVLRAAAEANPREPTVRVALAAALKQNGHYRGALDEIDVVLTTFPNFAPALREKIDCLRLCGSREEAKTLAHDVLLDNPHDAATLHQMAHILAEIGDKAAAELEFEHAADCEPWSPRHPKCQADLLVRTGSRQVSKLVKAKELYQLAQELGGDSWKSHLEKYVSAIDARIQIARRKNPLKPIRKQSRRSKGR